MRKRLSPLLPAALVAFGALAHGAVEPWALTAGHVALILTAAACGLRAIRRRGTFSVPRLPTDLPVLLFLAVAALSPVFSLCPRPSWLELIRILGCGLLFVLATSLFRRPRAVLATAWALTLFGAVFAVLGLTVYGSELFGLRTFSERSHRLSLTFANPNHFAALLSMCACLALGLAAAHRGVRRAFLLLCALATLTAVFFTASRGAVGALTAALVVLLVGLYATGGDAAARRRVLMPLAATVALTAGAAALLGPRLPLERLDTLRDPLGAVAGRQEIWAGTWEMVRQRPWTGSGLGTFRDAFTPHQPPRLADRVVRHAHNDYLELAAEAGLPALAAALLALVAFAAAALLRLRPMGAPTARRRGDRAGRSVGLGAFAGCVALLLHSAVDFNLHIPAVAWLFAVLAALSVVVPGVGRDAGARRSARSLPLPSPARRWTAGLAILLAAAVALAAVLVPYLGRRQLEEARQLASERRFKAAKALLEPASRGPFADLGIWVELGSAELALALHAADPELRRRSLEIALGHYQNACAGCPLRAGSFLKLAAAARHLGRFDDAEQAFTRAVELAPRSATGHFQLAGFELSRGKESAAAAYGRALELDPRLAAPIFERLRRAGWPPERIRASFPETAELRAQLAALLEQQAGAEGDAAIAELKRAFELEPTPRRARAHLEALFAAGRLEPALDVAETYRRRFPGDRVLLRQTIGILRRLERPAEAASLYRAWIELESSDPRPYASLGALLCAEDRYPEAVAVFAEGQAEAEASAELQLRLGLCHRSHGRHHPALGALMKASAMAPGEKLYRYHLGEQLRLVGLEQRAAVELRACLELDEEFGRCRSALARLGARR